MISLFLYRFPFTLLLLFRCCFRFRFRFLFPFPFLFRIPVSGFSRRPYVNTPLTTTTVHDDVMLNNIKIKCEQKSYENNQVNTTTGSPKLYETIMALDFFQ